MLVPLLAHPHAAATQRDRAGNRRLYCARYATVLVTNRLELEAELVALAYRYR
jgi:hypothetical protein